MPTLQKIIDIQKVGRFEKLTAPKSLHFSQVTLVFGENGWGKSTLADILRSLTRNQPTIIKGRETLAAGGQQKILLLVDGQQCVFDGTAWKGARPRIAVLDQAFVNENVYSRRPCLTRSPETPVRPCHRHGRRDAHRPDSGCRQGTERSHTVAEGKRTISQDDRRRSRPSAYGRKQLRQAGYS